MCCFKETKTPKTICTAEQPLSVGWMSYMNSSADRAEILQGRKLGRVNSRTASIKLILCSHFMSKTAGASEIFTASVCVLLVVTLFGNFCSLFH